MAIVFPSGTQSGPAVVNQVKNVVKTNIFDTTSSAWTTVSGLSVTITPSSTSKKILVSTAIVLCGEVNGRRFSIRLIRGSTPLMVSTVPGSRTAASYASTAYGAGNGGAFTAHQMYLDSPASTSAQTYAVQIIANDGGQVRINYGNNEADNSSHGRSASSITVMEVDV